MSVKEAFNKGFNQGIQHLSQKLAEVLEVDVNEVHRDLQSKIAEITGADIGLGATSLGLGGAGTGLAMNADTLSKYLGNTAFGQRFQTDPALAQSLTERLKAVHPTFAPGMNPAAPLDKATQQAVLDAFQAEAQAAGRGGRAHRASGALQNVVGQIENARQSKISPQLLKNVGRVLQGAGGLGAAGLIGKKVYDVATG